MNGFYDLFAEFADELTKYDRALKNAKVFRFMLFKCSRYEA